MPWHMEMGEKLESAVIKSAGRVFEVLEYFREVQRPLSVREIAERFKYPLSSTAVLLKSIATLGYVNFDQRTRAYFPNTRLAMLGDWVFESMYSNSELLELTEELGRRTGEMAFLSVQNDIYSQYVHLVPSQQPIQFYTRVGTRRLMCMSGTGWAMLSLQSDEAIARQVQRTITRLGKGAANITESIVMKHVDEARRVGYAFSRGAVTPGVGVIAMPLPIGTTEMRFAIAVAGVVEWLDARVDPIVMAMTKCIKEHLAAQKDKHKK
jgi:IclR family acetate operon transcriptional repressor